MAVARGCSSNFRCLIIHPGGNAPDFGLSLKSDGFKVGPPCQGVDNKIAAIACFLCTKICICCNSLCNICATKAKTCFMYFLLFCRKCLINMIINVIKSNILCNSNLYLSASPRLARAHLTDQSHASVLYSSHLRPSYRLIKYCANLI